MSDLTFGPFFKVKDDSLALVSCLSGGYRFALVLRCVGLVIYVNHSDWLRFELILLIILPF